MEGESQWSPSGFLQQQDQSVSECWPHSRQQAPSPEQEDEHCIGVRRPGFECWFHQHPSQ